MNGVSFPQQTKIMGKPEGWKDEDCYGLPVNEGYYLDSNEKPQPLLISFWKFSNEDWLAFKPDKFTRGEWLQLKPEKAGVYLNIVGFGMPPVSIQVNNPCPEDLEPGKTFHKTGKL